MPELKPFIATNTFRTDDSGYSAYATFARRAGSQYEQAGNDIRDIGRAKAATINMLGRWPFNILELEKRETERYYRGTRGAPGGSASLPRGFNVVSGGSSGSITDAQFAQRRMPNLAALNEMSEGAAAFGNMLGGSGRYPPGYRPPGSQYGNLTDLRLRREYEEARQEAIDERERARQEQLEYAAAQKRWDYYEKNLDKYNAAVEAGAQQASPYGVYGTSNDPASPYADPNSINYPTSTYIPSGDAYETPTYGGTTSVGETPTPSPSEGGTYGGTGSSSWW